MTQWSGPAEALAHDIEVFATDPQVNAAELAQRRLARFGAADVELSYREEQLTTELGQQFSYRHKVVLRADQESVNDVFAATGTGLRLATKLDQLIRLSPQRLDLVLDDMFEAEGTGLYDSGASQLRSGIIDGLSQVDDHFKTRPVFGYVLQQTVAQLPEMAHATEARQLVALQAARYGSLLVNISRDYWANQARRSA